MDKKQNISKSEFHWSLPELAYALKLSEIEIKEYFTDGRRVSFLLERRIANEVLKGKIAPSEGASFDVFDAHGGKWEIRSISDSGIYFCPSYMVGSGRSFDESGFIKKLNEIKGYIVSDITEFPKIPFWTIPVSVVKEWWNKKLLGTNSKVSRKNILKLLY